MGESRETRARDLAVRVAGAIHARRLYEMKGPIWERTIAGTIAAMERELELIREPELTLGLLGDGLAVAGVPIIDPPSSVLRLLGLLRERDVEIISVRRGVQRSELESLLAFLGSDAADVAGLSAESWLRERGVTSISVKHLRLMHGAGPDSFRDVYRRGGRVLAREFARAKEKGDVSLGAVSELARSLLEVITESETPIATLLALRDRDDFAMVHSVNVAMLAGAQAAALGIEGEEAERIIFAALMHDVGKTRVPEVVLERRGGLSAQERELLDRHRVEGARILFLTSTSDRVAAAVALLHHGPPPPDEEAFLPVELVRLADAFDGLRSLRPFSDERGMRGAVAFMARKLGERFNPYLLERLAALVGLFRPGDHALLTSGEIVRVLAPHKELGLRPRVEVLDSSAGVLERGVELDLADVPQDEREPRIIPHLPSALASLEPADLDQLG